MPQSQDQVQRATNRFPVVIEFMGPGGAGKSTLVAACHEWLKDDFAVRSSFGQTSWPGVLSSPLKWTRVFAQLFWVYGIRKRRDSIPFFSGNPLRERAYLLLSRVLPHQRKLSSCLTRTFDILLMEHGAVTFRYDLCAQSGIEPKALTLRCDAIVVMRVSSEEMIKRLHKRNLSKGPESLNIAQDEEYREKYLALVNSGISFAESSGIPVLNLDGSLPVRLLTKKVATFVKVIMTERYP